MGGELHFLVAPFGRAISTGDETHPVQTAEVAVDEGISAFGPLGGPDREPEMPFCVLVPGVTIEKRVLVVGSWLRVAPFAAKDIVMRPYQLLCLGDTGRIDFVLDNGLLD